MSELHTDPPTAEVDLTNCDREPIHALGHVQDFGCLVAVSADWMITHASTNCEPILGHAPGTLVGAQLNAVFSTKTIHDLRTRIQVLSYQDGAARLFAYALFEDARLFDLCITKSQQGFVFEFEPHQDTTGQVAVDDASAVQALIGRIRRHGSLEKMAQEAARGLRMLSGFDRVMVYKFLEDDSGTVIAETVEPGMEPFLGLRYPASDIPKQARALYLRSPLRIIANVDAPVHPIVPERDPNGAPLDLSLAVTRAVSPIHLEYLRNMGVAASMSVSIIRDDRLWGLFACHHPSARHIGYEQRSTIELFAQLFNYELAQMEMRAELSDVDRARGLHDRLTAQLSDGIGIAQVLDTFLDELREVIEFDGAAIYSEGSYGAVGAAPTAEEFTGLARFLNTTPAAQIYTTDSLAERYPKAEDFTNRAAGLLALPISRTPRDYLVFFRREIAQSVNWAGNPEKPVEVGPNGIRLTPRKSFEAWQEIVRHKCAPWKPAERRAAEALRVTLLEVVLKLADESNSARKRAQDQQELLIAELNHRVRNILNLIRGLVSQGNDGATSVDAYRSVLDSRIHALARAHDQLTATEWDWVSLRSLVRTEVKAFLSAKTERVHITGTDIDLTPTAFTTLALVVHELITNSAKYGALSDGSGAVDIDMTLEEDGCARLSWRERGGPPVQAPARKGFGTTIIERSIPFELKGSAELRYRIGGLEADFMLPARHVRKAAPQDETETAARVVPSAELSLPDQAMVLEDNMIIALDAVDMLTDLGAGNVQTASNVADALRVLDAGGIGFALLDVNLGDELSFPVIERCVAEGIPAIIATGYGSTDDLTERFPDVPILRKPYTLDDVRAGLSQALA